MNFSFLIIIVLITLVFSCRKLKLNNMSILLFVLMLLVLHQFYLYKGNNTNKVNSFNPKIPLGVQMLQTLRGKLQETVNRNNKLSNIRMGINRAFHKIKRKPTESSATASATASATSSTTSSTTSNTTSSATARATSSAT